MLQTDPPSPSFTTPVRRERNVESDMLLIMPVPYIQTKLICAPHPTA